MEILMQEHERERKLEELYARIRVCPDCDLSKTRTKAVPGAGPLTATVMFIGEGPGYHEDQQGLPFVGPAGKFLDELLAVAGLKRDEVYITNVVKCRPPQNRDPLPIEIRACAKYLDEQLALIQPKVVVTLGRYSMARWFPGESISKIHGQPRQVDGLTVVPMFHPAAALHQERFRSLIMNDFRKLPAILAQAMQTAAAPKKPPEPEQMRLF